MRRFITHGMMLLPLLITLSYGEQSWSADSKGQNFTVFSSDEGGTSSYLGVDIADVSAERLSALKLKEEKGVEVTMVDQDAPAGKAGIKEHDVILSMNGTAIESGAQLRRMIHEMPPGRVVSFGLSREGQPLTVKVQLADKHNEFWPHPNVADIHVNIPDIHIPEIDMPSINMVMVTSSARSGLMVENITPQLGEFFGVKNGNGVLVRSVEKGSRGEKSGIRAGDVIVKVNDEPVHDTSDFAHAVKSRNGKSVSVGVIRDKKEQNLNLTLPENKESGSLLQEESSEDQRIEAEDNLELSEVQGELAELRPDIEFSSADAAALASDLAQEACPEQQKVRQQGAKAKQRFALKRKRSKKDQEKLEMELDQLDSEFIGHSFDI